MLLHRSTLIKTLEESLPPAPICTVHTSSRLVSYQGNEPVVLTFADGTTRTADVVIGADGVRSVVRAGMFPGGMYEGKKVEPKWTGVVAYRSLITRTMLERVQDGQHRALTQPIIVCFVLFYSASLIADHAQYCGKGKVFQSDMSERIGTLMV
jgi:salicylate hydroxylase